MKKLIIVNTLLSIILMACSNSRRTTDTDTGTQNETTGPEFSADSAYAFCAAQCGFGPRIMNSAAHDECGKWIVEKFRSYGMDVTTQNADLKGYDGTILKSTNIIASFKPELSTRILLCAHWDSRPWADNDPDSANWRKPVMGANDGASGVAVMLEVARLLHSTDSMGIGVDFICFDAEDRGAPQWDEENDNGNSWAMGSQYWSANPHKNNYQPLFGILLDMVGGQGAKFYQEGVSLQYARNIVDKVWAAADIAGYGSLFPKAPGGMVTDDHVSLNEVAGIPTIDIIAYYPDCVQSSFGPTWHTVNDNMDYIDRNSLKAVGQTVIQVLFSER
ncbi:M28 family peptidase [Xylanibacter muris]|uniref:M28 family peptidase n=1 Tax=Xylanibacter muris TaxID=2736290 RepID=A0ABX2AIT9_9BACT|nr:M28 family peptidase [Xylanibacter muris]NPD90921.1 M28 family peptidase [Xylanibacter muris]